MPHFAYLCTGRLLSRFWRSSLLMLALTFGYTGTANATLWQVGDLVTYTQAEWGDVPDGTNIASVLDTNYNTVYAPFGVFEVGLPGVSGFSMIFSNSTSLLDYLPSVGNVAPLNADLLDPASSASGSFGGNVASVKLNIDFADANLIHGTLAIDFGDLILSGLTATPDFNNLTVRQSLALLNSALGGAPTADSIADLDLLARQLNGAFFSGPSTFAQDHLNAPDGSQPPPTVAEPTSISLVLLGLLGLTHALRRKRTRQEVSTAL